MAVVRIRLYTQVIEEGFPNNRALAHLFDIDLAVIIARQLHHHSYGQRKP